MLRINYSDNIETLNMSHERLSNLFLIDVTFDHTVVPLVFDTGASITIISKSVSDIINAVSLTDSITGIGNANSHTTVEKHRIDAFSIGNTIINNLCVGIVDDEVLNFGTDENGCDLKVNGFLGWDIIQHFKWDVKTKERLFSLEKPVKKLDCETLYWDNMPIVMASFNDQQMYFGFDTGNTESMLNHHFIPLLENKKVSIDLITGIDGVVEEDVIAADEIELLVGTERLTLSNVSVLNRDLFPTKEYQVMGLLGSDILENRNFVIDYSNHDFRIY